MNRIIYKKYEFETSKTNEQIIRSLLSFSIEYKTEDEALTDWQHRFLRTTYNNPYLLKSSGESFTIYASRPGKNEGKPFFVNVFLMAYGRIVNKKEKNIVTVYILPIWPILIVFALFFLLGICSIISGNITTGNFLRLFLGFVLYELICFSPSTNLVNHIRSALIG